MRDITLHDLNSYLCVPIYSCLVLSSWSFSSVSTSQAGKEMDIALSDRGSIPVSFSYFLKLRFGGSKRMRHPAARDEKMRARARAGSSACCRYPPSPVRGCFCGFCFGLMKGGEGSR